MAAPQRLPSPNWVERREHPAFRYRKRSRTVVDTAEEAYLRVDIACGSPACQACPPTAPALPPAPRHLVLPDAAALKECLEVWELSLVEGTVLLSSELRQLVDGGNMRRSARLQALYTDRRRRNVLFDNLHHRETAPRGGAAERRSGLALLAAAEWYYEHLGRQLPVVVVSDLLAQQFAAPAAAQQQQQQQSQQQQPRRHGGRPTVAAAGGEEEDAELDALLRQMDIGAGGGGSSSSAVGGRPALPLGSGGAASGADDIGGLLESLGLGDTEPAAPAQQHAAAAPYQGQEQARQQQQQQQQQQQLELEPGVHILSAADYFGGCWAHCSEVTDVFDSIQQSKAAADEAAQQAQQAGGAGGGFRPHFSAAALEGGLASGALLAGTLCASRRVPGEATVAVGGRQLLLSGRSALNRAVHGDRVAVRLLPREQWRPLAELASAAAGDRPAGGEGPAKEEEPDEHDLLATAGDGEADVAADEAPQAGAAGDDEPLDSVAVLLQTAAAGALQPTAEVVGILQRWSGEIVACISEEDERALEAKGESSRQESVLCIPSDRRLPKIRLRSRQLHRLLGQRLVLRLDGWELGSNYPHGHLVRSLGPINSLRSETDGVLVSSGVHWQPFSEGALRELPPVRSSAEYVIPPAELAARRDLRGPQHLVCSIDPPGCTDVDDALSVRWLCSAAGRGGRQLVEVGVHIADVSFFVRQGDMLDSEAASRCTTVYLVDRRLDMLPALLSEDLCSLRGGQDRYAVSVLWTLDAESFEVQDTWFGRTLIRSRYQLEYSQAQDIMDDRPPKPGQEVAPNYRPLLQRNLRLLAALAEHQRQLRLEAGAVELESAELRFNTDPQGQPTTVTVKQEIPMMRIVAEMMILANAAVGRRIATAFPRAALLRRHPPPRREAFAEVEVLCESLGAPLDFASPVALSASLAAAAAAAPPAVSSLIKSLATRAMSEAEYFCTGDAGRGGGGMGHFGLALPYYTHFTSPIRRYADVVVHRQLLAAVAASGHGAALAGQPPSATPALPPPLPGSEVADKAAVMNERHRTAKRAQKDCSDLYLLLLLHSQPHVEAATVYGLRRSSLLIFIPKYHLKGVIHLTDRQGVCKPPLRAPGDEQLDDPFVLSYRRGLAVVASSSSSSGVGSGGGGDGDGEEGQPAGQPAELAVVESASGRQVAAFCPLQHIWVQLSADGSRVHGPSLRMRLLADSHPAAAEAARREAAAEALSSGAAGTAGPACAAYRPPGLGKPAVPPGFEGRTAGGAAGVVAGGAPPTPAQLSQAPAAVAAAADANGGSAVSAGAAAAEPATLAAQLQAALEQAGGSPEDRQALAWQAAVPAVGQLPAGDSSCTSPSSDGASSAAATGSGAAQQAQQAQALGRALRRLQARLARLQLRAGTGPPGRPSTERWAQAAAAAHRELAVLQQQLVPG
ncbi:hypothetical protein ABPG75_000251 [Micractinium tetrahymenae]